MECDWEVEIGGDAPVIDARWEGFVDLSTDPERAAELPEAAGLPGLADALVRLNRPGSNLWTAKCDLWPVNEIDVYELDAPPDSASKGVACYIDLLPTHASVWSTTEEAVTWCKRSCDLLEGQRMRCCRADLIVRSARVNNDSLDAGTDLGVTAYLAACGANELEATATLSVALATLVDAITGPALSTTAI